MHWLAGVEAIVVGDGGMATMLQAAGLPLGRAPELWNLERPDLVGEVHARYARTGAAWATTNSFGATRGRLAGAGLAARAAEVNRAAVRCAREGAPGCRVLGSIGPTLDGEWEAEYEEQVAALAAELVDGFMVETIVRLKEGVAAVRIAAAAGSGPVVACYSPAWDGTMLDGTTPEAAAEALAAAGAAVIGINCGAGPESLLGPARRLVRAEVAPVLAAPNAGLPEVEDGSAVYRLAPDAFARAAIQLQEAGVRLLAGCCGTTPDHIRAAIRALSLAQ